MSGKKDRSVVAVISGLTSNQAGVLEKVRMVDEG